MGCPEVLVTVSFNSFALMRFAAMLTPDEVPVTSPVSARADELGCAMLSKAANSARTTDNDHRLRRNLLALPSLVDISFSSPISLTDAPRRRILIYPLLMERSHFFIETVNISVVFECGDLLKRPYHAGARFSKSFLLQPNRPYACNGSVPGRTRTGSVW